jgi:Na+-translocating ferredoxin:NAD+ oxidoreductase RnfD subunit
MRSSTLISLLNVLLLCIPVAAIAAWVWGWRTLGTVLLGTIVVGLIIDAALESDRSSDRVLGFLAGASIMLIGVVGLVVAGVVALNVATLLGVPQL